MARHVLIGGISSLGVAPMIDHTLIVREILVKLSRLVKHLSVKTGKLTTPPCSQKIVRWVGPQGGVLSGTLDSHARNFGSTPIGRTTR